MNQELVNKLIEEIQTIGVKSEFPSVTLWVFNLGSMDFEVCHHKEENKIVLWCDGFCLGIHK